MNLPSDDECKIEGYAAPISVSAGEQIAFHVSTNAKSWAMEIARVGADRHVVWRKDGRPGARHSVPENASTHGCDWPVSLELTIPQEWRSGYYSVMLRAAGSNGSDRIGECFFVVRPPHPGRDARILLQLTTNTSSAYNTWGGSSLYRGPREPGRRVSLCRPYAGLTGVDGIWFFSMPEQFSDDLQQPAITERFREEFQGRVHENSVPGILLSAHASITVEQPGRQWWITDLQGSGPAGYRVRKRADQLDVYDGTTAWECGWRNWQHPFVAWAEREGYRIDYAVNSDLEYRPEMLASYRLILSVGHDEYWSAPMRDHLEDYIDSGGNVAFFGGNTCYWQVRSEDDGRALVGWKDAHERDPVYQSGDLSRLTTLWCDRQVGRPENHLTGVSFAYGGYSRFFDQFQDASGGYTVHRPDHWVFARTGLERGDIVGATDRIVTYECDGCDLALKDGRPVPTHCDGTPESFEILATAPAGLTVADNSLEMISHALYGKNSFRQIQQPGAAVLGLYSRGGTVVTVGCTHWAHGLRGKDKAVMQITRNILDRLSS